ncbi:MAG: hypothetical protein LBH21_03125 [Gracilibacteraceae bacterium]|nr:hypothetical protein [Gracilibacteraceae bacterium]
MKKLAGKYMKLMRVIHVFCAQIWFGGVCCIFVYGLYCFGNNLEKDAAIKLIEIIPFLYQKLIMPFSVVCGIQGLIYGIFSSYGFIKHKWVLTKWILAVFVIICTGAGGIGQVIAVIEKINSGEIAVLTMSDGQMFFVFMIGQILLLSVMTILSVVRPKRKAGA